MSGRYLEILMRIFDTTTREALRDGLLNGLRDVEDFYADDEGE